jgi:hypothetical protein
MLDPDKDKKIQAFYYKLKNVLDAAKKISLPYANIKAERLSRSNMIIEYGRIFAAIALSLS